MKEFKYLGSNLTSENKNQVEVKSRLMTANKSYYALQKYPRSSLIFRNSKLRIYKTVITLVAMYVAETWVLTKEDTHLLNRRERKISSKIYGPIQE